MEFKAATIAERRLSNSRTMRRTGSSEPAIAATAPYCAMEVGFDVLWS
jgi:hypothetical protein